MDGGRGSILRQVFRMPITGRPFPILGGPRPICIIVTDAQLRQTRRVQTSARCGRLIGGFFGHGSWMSLGQRKYLAKTVLKTNLGPN